MKIVDKRKFIRSLIIIGGFIFIISFICASKTLSHSNTNYKTIYVSSGDTLWTIAKEEKNNNIYFESKDVRNIVDEIKYANNLNESNLKIGQELSIPVI